MNTDAFRATLQADGFGEVATVERAVGYELGEHQHPFDARALITQGEITLVVDAVATTYGVGAVFRLAADVAHLEHAGPDGVVYLVGRRRVGPA